MVKIGPIKKNAMCSAPPRHHCTRVRGGSRGGPEERKEEGD